MFGVTLETVSSNRFFQPKRWLWLTFDFARCLSSQDAPRGDAPRGDDITPQLFLILMAHPAIKQLKRFTKQAENLGPDDIAQWEPGIFTMQAARANVLEVLVQVSSCLEPYLVVEDGAALEMTVYTQLGRKHYPLVTGLDARTLEMTAADIESMVQRYEQNQANAPQQL